MNFKKFKGLTGVFLSIAIITTQIPGFSTSETKQQVNETLENTYEEEFVLIDANTDMSSQPISVPSSNIQSFETSSDGYMTVNYTLDGVNMTGRYLEKDIKRKLHDKDLDLALKSRSADMVAASLGYEQLKVLAEKSTEEIIVAVIDTGVDATHSLLKDRLVRGYDVINDDHTVEDEDGHGTHVAGIIALSSTDNVKIMPISVFENGSALDSSIVEGIHYAVKNGAKIINLSLGGYGKTSYLENGIKYARNNGVMVVTTSGNEAHDNQFDYPGAFEDVITVGATNNTNTLLYYSNYGQSVDICAPGEKIISTYLDDSVESLSGTSMAAPFVSAAAAMLWLDQSNLPLAQVEAKLLENTKDLGVAGKDIAFGHGEIDFTNYKSSTDFYMIGHFTGENKKSLEFKYDLPLKYYAGPDVKSIEVKIDKTTVLKATISNGVYKNVLDIRNLSVGSHNLTVDVTMKNGTTNQQVLSAFEIPQFNVRVKAFDIYGEEITNDLGGESAGYLIGNHQYDIYREFKALTRSNNGFQMNVDFTKEAQKNLYYYLCYRTYSPEIPVYLRGAYTTGDYYLEPSEAMVSTYRTDLPVADDCRVIYQIPTVLDANVNGSNIPWTFYQVWDFTNIYYPVTIDEDTDTTELYFYHDQFDYYLDIFGTLNDSQDQSYKIRLFGGFTDELSSEIQSSALYKYLDVQFDSKIMPEVYAFEDILSRSAESYMGYESGSFLTSGIYDFCADLIYKTGNDTFMAYIFRNQFDLTRVDDYQIKVGDTIQSQVWPSLRKNVIYNQWTDAYDNKITALTCLGFYNRTLYVPTLVLKDIRTQKTFRIQGEKTGMLETSFTSTYLTDMYQINQVSNGTYEVTFEFEKGKEFAPFEVEQSYTVITIKNGTVISESNTPPKSVGSLTYVLLPQDQLSLDLTTVFWDQEQRTLFYESDDGKVLGDYFYYQDILKQDKDILITAHDGAGGKVSMKLTLLIGDQFENDNDFEPIQDIITIGASNWAKAPVAIAIENELVNNDILDNYQSEITRSEISEQVIKLIEQYKGRLSIAKTVSFFDTQNESILKAVSLGIMGGIGNGMFGPENSITNQELSVILFKSAQVTSGKAFNTTNSVQGFSDWGSVASWAKESMTFCVNNQIITGTSGKLTPKRTVTREQAISMIVKLYQGIESDTLK